MISFRQLRESSDQPRIKIEEKFAVYRDGGSHGHKVLNTEECGFVTVVQDFSIGAKRRQAEGQFFGMLPPPNHTNDKWVKISADAIDWS